MILVSGEALVDLVADRDGSIVAHAGGAAFNVCRTIARLETPAAFFGALSDDRFGATSARRLGVGRRAAHAWPRWRHHPHT